MSVVSDGKGLRGGEGTGADGDRLKDDAAICFKYGERSDFRCDSKSLEPAATRNCWNEAKMGRASRSIISEPYALHTGAHRDQPHQQSDAAEQDYCLKIIT
jgi:hypothetical protein